MQDSEILQPEINYRKEQLCKALAVKNLDLKPEYYFAQQYILGRTQMPLDVIVNKIDFENKRQKEIILALEKVGLQPRQRSYLVSAYIDGVCSMNLNEIVEKLCEQHYLYQYTFFTEYLKQMTSDESISKGLNIGSIKNIARQKALNEKPYPKIWPWLTGISEINNSNELKQRKQKKEKKNASDQPLNVDSDTEELPELINHLESTHVQSTDEEDNNDNNN